MEKDFDPEGRRLPIKIDSASNGEFAPRPLSRIEWAANAEALRFVGKAAKRTALPRRAFLKTMGGRRRAMIHGGVMPNEPGALDFMEVQAREYGVSAWKTYPQWGPDGVGYYMDDPKLGIPFIEKARELGIKLICAHRGLSLAGFAFEYSDPADIARVAARYPDVTFICYHSGYEPGLTEGPYDPDSDYGVDRLISARQENGFKPNQGNLYAELGTVWRVLMSKPDQAAHFMGKLLKYFGEERICWGTDALWYGSPQDQIQAFRSFQISEAFQERYGYPALTPQAKHKIFGENAAPLYGLDVQEIRQAAKSDRIAQLKRAYSADPNPSFQTFGPRTRRDFLLAREERFRD